MKIKLNLVLVLLVLSVTLSFHGFVINSVLAQILGEPTQINRNEQIVTPNSSDIENEFANWASVTGNWTLSDGGLHGADNNHTLNNVILSPHNSSQVSSVSTSFNIDQLDEGYRNYASIVYSFNNSENFNQAGVSIYNDTVYVIFTDIVNGEFIHQVAWPGIETNLVPNPQTLFNMSLTADGNNVTLFLNNEEYSHEFDDINLDGNVGLSNGRIGSIDFHNFYVQQYADNEHTVSDSQNLFLEDRMIPSGNFIHLYDSSPYKIISGHIAAKLPCDETSSPSVEVLIGQAPNLRPADLEFIEPLSSPGETCLYHANIVSDRSTTITDIALQNNSPEDIDLPETGNILINVNKISPIDN